MTTRRQHRGLRLPIFCVHGALAPGLGELLTNRASSNVNRTARRGGHDAGDLFGREGLRVGVRGRERGAGKCEAGEEKVLAVHGGFFRSGGISFSLKGLFHRG